MFHFQLTLRVEAQYSFENPVNPYQLQGILTLLLPCNVKSKVFFVDTSEGQLKDSQFVSITILAPKHAYDLYSLPNIVRVVKSRRMRWVGHVARMMEGRVVHKVLVGKPEGKGPLGRPRRRWEDNIKRDLQEIVRGFGDWMKLAQDRDR